MAFLISVWTLALATVVATLVAAARGVEAKQHTTLKAVPVGWWDMYVVTYQDIIRAIIELWHGFLPFIHNGITHALSHMIAWRDKVYAKLFGYHAVPQGGVVSFFLKRVSERKEEFRQKEAERKALHATPPVEEYVRKHDFSALKPDHKQ